MLPGWTDWRGEEQHLEPSGWTRILLAGCYSGGRTRSTPDSEIERRRFIGVVHAVQLFSGSVLENLTLGDPDGRGSGRACCPHRRVEGLIQSLPKGYDTQISNGAGEGVQLSSGQRQMLSLARALIWDPAVLLFDEATSAIDSASEAAFRQALLAETSRHQRAILTVAHRLSTAEKQTAWSCSKMDLFWKPVPSGVDPQRRAFCCPFGIGSCRLGLACRYRIPLTL